MFKRLNEFLTGFRGILLNAVIAGVGYFGDSFFAFLTGFSKEAAKGAAIAAGLNMVKLMYTDAWPKIKLLISPKGE